MRRTVILAIGCVALAVAAWASNDSWKDKPYQQWDSKDLQRIFQDSPWVHIVRVDAPWLKGGGSSGDATIVPSGGAPAGGGPPAGGGGHMGGYGSSSGGGGNTAGSPTVGGDSSDSAPSAAFAVRWISSRTFREAMLRDRVLRGQMTEAEAQADLIKPVEGIELAVLGPDMTPFQSMDENALKSAAFLAAKHSKTKVAPTEVRIQKNGDKIVGILFIFPAKAENGEPSISPEEKTVEFAVTAGKLTLKSEFDVSKMTDSQGRDI